MRSEKMIVKLILFILICWCQFGGLINVVATELENQDEVIIDDSVIEDNDTDIDSGNEIVSGYKVYLDGEEQLDYVLEDKDVLVKQSYDGDILEYTFNTDEEFIMDYTNHLYGEYNYKFSVLYYEEELDSKDVIINYVGDNNNIINTKGIYYKDKTYYILGSIDKNYTVLDVLSMFNEELSQYGASIEIINSEGIDKLDSDEVVSGDKIKLSASYIEYGNKNDIVDYFDIEIIGDVNSDEVIDNLDIKSMIVNSIINSEDNIFDIKDITNVGLNEEIVATDILNSMVEYEEEVYIDEYLEVKYYINGFINDSLEGVIGKINYDKNLLKLENVSIDSIYGAYNESGSFGYLLNNYNKDGLFITFKFKVLGVGSSNISLDEIKFITSGGDYASVNDSLFSIDILGIEYGKGGDVEDNNKEDEVLEDEEKEEENIEKDEILEEVEKEEDKEEIIYLDKKEPVYVKPDTYEELLPSNDLQSISLSSDNYIKSLEIKGYEISFNKDVFEYEIQVSADTFELELDIELNDDDAFYTIYGNENFKVGNNEVSIVVTALDGTTRSYVINVEKTGNVLEEEDSTLEDEKNSSRKIIIMLIILVIIGLVYIIFKDEEPAN